MLNVFCGVLVVGFGASGLTAWFWFVGCVI